MKRLFLIATLFLLMSYANAQEWVGVNKSTPVRIQEKLVSSSEDAIVVDIFVEGFFKETVTTPKGKQIIVSGEDMAAMLVKGAPDVPMYPIPLIIGDEAEMQVSVVESKYVDFKDMEIAPSKGNFSRQINPDDVPYLYGEMYNQDAFYPAQVASLSDPYILRDFRGQNLMVYPYVYNPATKTLRVYTYLRIAAEKVSDDGQNKKLGRKRNNTIDPEMNYSYQRRFINYPTNQKYTFLEDEGEMLIVCVDQYIDELQHLVNWKNISGRPTKMVPVSETGTTDDLKNYISNYYKENPNLTYLLLVGEHNDLPAYPVDGERSDNYYGMLEGDDYYEEVLVGRLPVNSLKDAKNQVDKIIYYERDINEKSFWLSKASGIAAKEGYGHFNEVDYEHMDFIRDTLLNYTYTEVSQYYANVNNPTASAMVAEYSKGRGLINYCNHGNYDKWSVANFTNSDVYKLTNDNKWPIIWSVACLNGKFSHDECFAEAWMRATNPETGAPTGAIGGMFSWITQPWIPPMYGQDEMNAILTEWREGYKHTLGGASCNGNMYVLDMDPFEGPLTHNTWLLFGDPSLMVRTKAPELMNVSISMPELFVGMSELDIDAETDFGIATLSFDGEILASSYLKDGKVNLKFNPLTQTGKLKLVVVGYNKVTEVIDINVTPAENPYLIFNGCEIQDDNAQLDYAETVTLDIDIKNVGLMPAENVTVKLSTESPYITIIDDNEQITGIASNEIVTLDKAFSVEVKPNIPDKTEVEFYVTCSNDKDTWKTKFVLDAAAPVFDLDEINVISENGAMPGSTATLKLSFKNIGGADAYDVITEVFSGSSEVEMINPSNVTEKVLAGESFSVTTDVNINASVQEGSVYELVCSVNADYNNFSTKYELRVGANGDGFESGDFSANEWKIEGVGKWVVSNEDAYDGDYCAKTEPILNNQYSKLKIQLEVLSEGPLTFYYKVSSEQYYDYMAFIVNGLQDQKWHGEIGWQQYTYNMKPGNYALEWRYIKDSSGSEGEDCAWLDKITFPPIYVVTILEPVSDLVYNVENQKLDLTWTAAEDAEEYIIRRDGEVVSTQSETTFSENIDDDIYTYSVVARKGNNYSAPAFIVVDPNRKFDESLSEINKEKLSVYPNPTSGILFVDYYKTFNAVVYNYQGQIVMKQKINDGQIDMSNLNSGIYFLEIRDGDNVMIEKIVVR